MVQFEHGIELSEEGYASARYEYLCSSVGLFSANLEGNNHETLLLEFLLGDLYSALHTLGGGEARELVEKTNPQLLLSGGNYLLIRSLVEG